MNSYLDSVDLYLTSLDRYNYWEILTMSAEHENKDPREGLSESERRIYDQVIGFIKLSFNKINGELAEGISLRTFQMSEKMEETAAKRLPDSEFFLIQDEFVRDVTSLTINAKSSMVNLVTELGIFTREQAEAQIAQEVQGLEDYPKASWLIAHQKDEDGWLAEWLLQNPAFFANYLKGQWPDWLPKPISQDSDK